MLESSRNPPMPFVEWPGFTYRPLEMLKYSSNISNDVCQMNLAKPVRLTWLNCICRIISEVVPQKCQHDSEKEGHPDSCSLIVLLAIVVFNQKQFPPHRSAKFVPVNREHAQT